MAVFTLETGKLVWDELHVQTRNSSKCENGTRRVLDGKFVRITRLFTRRKRRIFEDRVLF